MKEARKVYMKKYREENREKLKLYRSWIKKKYGISWREYDKINEKQNGVCLICGKPPKLGRHLDVDHCHKTGRIRGLLCNKCNHGLGDFEDDPKLLLQGILYLLRLK